METIKRAVIVAAGEGKRLRPVTQEIPKPLVSVNGTRMIDTAISALRANGIREIYIVAGYLREQFHKAFDADPEIQVIDNLNYDKGNNITSLYLVREHLPGAFIMDGDQMIRNPQILNPAVEKSGYCATWEEETDEWALDVKDNSIVSCSVTGGKNAYRLWSVSMWTERDGQLLSELIRKEFEDRHNWDVFWDEIPMLLYADRFDLGIREVNETDLMEIDTLRELAQADPKYRKYVD